MGEKIKKSKTSFLSPAKTVKPEENAKEKFENLTNISVEGIP